MTFRTVSIEVSEILRGRFTLGSLKEGSWKNILAYLLIIFISLFTYGLTVGMWRSPIQGIYAGIKFPLVVILTSVINGLINGILGKLYGANLNLGEATRCMFVSYIIAGLLLASLSPVFFFFVINAPPLGDKINDRTYSLILLGHIAAISIAGFIANTRLYNLVSAATSSPLIAKRIILVWLFLNLFVGSQLSWNLRPFIGSPNLPVQFIRPDAFKGNFFEAVLREFNNVMD